MASKHFAEKLEEAWRIRREVFGSELRVYVPGARFISLSITGRRCELMCKHCSGYYLRNMTPAETPHEFLSVCRALRKRGGYGCLVSGGFDREGKLPVEGFVEAIAEAKKETELVFNIHPGFVNRRLAKKLAEAGVDAASVDVVGDSRVVEEVYGLRKSPEDYEVLLRSLKDAGIDSVSPHVCVGLWYGRESKEEEALNMIRSVEPEVLVFTVLIPTRGTPMEGVSPPPPERVAELIALARISMPDVEISLGCMRPGGPYRRRLDALAIQAGVNRIAVPSTTAIRSACKTLEVKKLELCCALSRRVEEKALRLV